MTELDGLISEAELGEEVRKFLESDLGKALLGFAEQDARAAEIALGEVDPDDKKAIVVLQNKIKLCKFFGQWLAELLSRGNDALEAFKQQRSN